MLWAKISFMKKVYEEEYNGYIIKVFKDSNGNCIIKIFRDNEVVIDYPTITIKDCDLFLEKSPYPSEALAHAKEYIDEQV
jgi:hypothetical protein